MKEERMDAVKRLTDFVKAHDDLIAINLWYREGDEMWSVALIDSVQDGYQSTNQDLYIAADEAIAQYLEKSKEKEAVGE
jgi:hypothetical protein